MRMCVSVNYEVISKHKGMDCSANTSLANKMESHLQILLLVQEVSGNWSTTYIRNWPVFSANVQILTVFDFVGEKVFATTHF